MEREKWLARESEGFARDAIALEAHIARLKKVTPKRVLGNIDGRAQRILDDLERVLARAKKSLAS